MKQLWHSIRSCLAIMIVATVCYGFLTGKVAGEVIVGLAGTVVALYFTRDRSSENHVEK